MGVPGDDERLELIRERLANGERVSAARFAAAIANRSRTDEERSRDADTLAALVRLLADALIAAGDKHKGRGRPKGRADDGLLDLLLWAGSVEYQRIVTAAEVVNGREVSLHDAARLLWWALIGHEWEAKRQAGETVATPDEVIAKIEAMLADTAHEHHKHYSAMLQRVAGIVTQEAGAGDVDAQGFRTRLRGLIVERNDRLGMTDSLFRRMLTRTNRGASGR